MHRSSTLVFALLIVVAVMASKPWNAEPARAANACGSRDIWINDLAYGTPGGGVYWDPLTSMVWTPAQGWHYFSPTPPRPNPSPLWVNQLDYGSKGRGYYWDPLSGQVWTAERGWHAYGAFGCGAPTSVRLTLKSGAYLGSFNEHLFQFEFQVQGAGGGDWYLFVEAAGKCRDKNGTKLGRPDSIGVEMANFADDAQARLMGPSGTIAIETRGYVLAPAVGPSPTNPVTCAELHVSAGYFANLPILHPHLLPTMAEVYVPFVFTVETKWEPTAAQMRPCPTCTGTW